VNNVYHLEKFLPRLTLLFFLFFYNLTAQINLHNFGICENIKTQPGNTKFLYLDYNKDGLQDLFLFGNQRKNFVLHQGLKNSSFSAPINKFFFFPIDDFNWFAKSASGDDYYLFVSRNKRLAGLVSFTKSFSLQLLHTIQFDSYPSSIKITDFDNDGNNEALIFGNNFNGIVILRNDGYRLNSEVVYSQNVFSDLILLDINQDELSDIIAVSVLNNSIQFLENTEIGGFISNREIEIDESIFSLQKFDFNNDDFVDIAITKENAIEIFTGDSVYTYSNSEIFEFDFTPNSYVAGDFNSDIIEDLAIMNKADDKLVMLFDYLEKKQFVSYNIQDIEDIKNQHYGNKKALSILSRSGNILILKNNNSWGKEFSLTVQGQPGKLDYKVDGQGKKGNLFYYDEIANSVNIIELDSIGNFSNLKSNSFFNNISEFKYSIDLSQLVGYSEKNRLLEITILNHLESSDRNQYYIYTDKPIHKVIIDKNNNIQILEIDESNLYKQTIKYLDDVYVSEKINLIDSLVINSNITKNGQVYYWNKQDSIYCFNTISEDIKKTLIKIEYPDSLIPETFILTDQNKISDKVVTIFNYELEKRLYLIDDENVNQFNSTIFSNESHSVDNIKYYATVLNNGKLYLYNKKEKRINEFHFVENTNNITLSNKINVSNITDYFFQQYYGKNYLIFTEFGNNSLTFKVLN